MCLSFPGKINMKVDHVYTLANTAQNRSAVDKAISNPKDNSDYVVYNKGDKLLVATGKGDLLNHDKGVQLGVDKAVKFNFQNEDHEALKVVNKVNTGSEFVRSGKRFEWFNPGLSVGAPAVGSFLGMMVGGGISMAMGFDTPPGAKIGLAVGAAVGAGLVIGGYFLDKKQTTTIKHPDMDYLAEQGVAQKK